MKLQTICVAAGLAFAAVPASAATVVLDFEGVGDQASVNDFYNGGTDSAGNSGVNYGINFSTASLAITDGDTKGNPTNGNFANEPSPDTILFFLSGNKATMNVVAGFDTGFSFFYSSSTEASIIVYDGLDGSGNILATLDLSLNWQNNNCTGDPTGQYCNWDAIGVSFAGVAKSVDFTGSANFTGYDDITLGASTPGVPNDSPPTSTIPEPATWGLMIIGFGALGYAVRRRRSSGLVA